MKEQEKKRFTIMIDTDLWYQVGVRVAKLSAQEGRQITRWSFVEDAIREKLERDKDK